MNKEVLEEMLSRLDRAHKFRLTIGNKPTMHIEECCGDDTKLYVIPDLGRGTKTCTFLEALLIGEDAITGDMVKDAAHSLKVSPAELEAFFDGLFFQHFLLRQPIPDEARNSQGGEVSD